ncbi:MAG: hypothetical protein Q8M15_16405 [Bacteroidota bacterium]|nr:hypothetical protein [Bacteroidota bacterium]
MKVTVIILLFIFVYGNFNAKSQVSREYQQRELLAYNILFGGITAGIGSAINKPKGSKLIKTVCAAFAYGMLGGVINFSSKKVLYNINKNEDYRFAWIANTGSCMGNSIIYNASLNNKFGSYWFFDLWAARVELNLRDKSENKFKIKVLPNALIGSCIYFAQKATLDVRTTLQTGIITFTLQSNPYFYGNTYMRAIGTEKNSAGVTEYLSYAHEMTHYFQFREHLVFNTWLKPFSKKVPKVPKAVFEKWVYLDIPWFYGFYALETQNDLRNYYQNFYEYEAQFFATNSYVSMKLW